MSFKAGDRVSITVTVTDKMVRQFAEASGDFNPIHMDDEYAKKTRFGRRIAHGMLAGALISRALAMSLGEGIYLTQSLKFLKPIFIDDEVQVELYVTSEREDKGIASIETTVKKIPSGELAVKGDAMIMKGDFIK